MKTWCIELIYKYFLKKIFFLFDAENVHNFMTTTGEMLGKTAIGKGLTRILFCYKDKRLEKNVDGIFFPNIIGLPAGFDYNAALTDILPEVGFGFETVGTVTLEPYEGNAKPRLGRFPKSKALLVNKGLKSLGAREVIRKLKGKKFQFPVGISIGATNRSYKNTKEQIENYIEGFRLFEKSGLGHAYYELNISCPNTFGGEPFTTADRLEQLLVELNKLKPKKPVYIKMPIDQDEKATIELLETAKKYECIFGVIFGNLTKDKTNPEVDPQDKKRWLEVKGNLSGKPTYLRSNRYIKLTKERYKDRFTIIGCGGIFSPEDAMEKIKLGADLLQLVTGMIFEGPQLIGKINRKLATYTPEKDRS